MHKPTKQEINTIERLSASIATQLNVLRLGGEVKEDDVMSPFMKIVDILAKIKYTEEK